MSNNQNLHVIFGTGPLGQSVMRELLTRPDVRIRMVNRTGKAEGVPSSVEIVANDACSTVGGIMNVRTGDLTIENSIIAENTAGRYRPGRWGLANLATTDGVTPTVVGQNNYWGSPDGPSGEGPGNGDGIYGAAPTSYTPWLVQPPDWAQN